jgi:Glycosyl hydrolases family 16
MPDTSGAPGGDVAGDGPPGGAAQDIAEEAVPVSGVAVADTARTPDRGPPSRHGRRGLRDLVRRHPILTTAIGIALVTGMVLALVLPSRGGPAPGPAGGPRHVTWSLAFDENFTSGTGGLTGSGVWHEGWFGHGPLTAAVNSKEKAIYDAANLSVSGGTARLEVTPNSTHRALPNGTTQPNLGAMINTDDDQAQTGFMVGYGYVEARMQLPAGSSSEGLWPSFWLSGHTWPDDMEIDVVEGDGSDRGKFNLHYGSHNNDTVTLDRVDRYRTVSGATTGMHTYAADIRPDGVTFYYDGAAVYAYHGKVPDARRFLAVGLSSSGTVTTPKTLQVDYVRAWTRG